MLGLRGGIPRLETVCQARHLLRLGFSSDQAVALIRLRRRVQEGTYAGDVTPCWQTRAGFTRWLIAHGRLTDWPVAAAEVTA